ncbi:MAG TPA: RT0821/Lpp0805 family surface protein [Stellaceae bacterium]|nr:RT0821/Lpp0805 family surface protein [Stellaceae bacterium]
MMLGLCLTFRRLSGAPALAALLALSLPGAARAQNNTYGTDQRYCDHSAMSQIFSTSTGNLVGSAAGAAAGGLVGSQLGKGSGKTVATIVGVLGGALGGGFIGRSMDPADRGCVGTSLQNAPTNQPVAWQNPSTGSSYWVTPTADLRGPNGEPCRRYVADAVINGQRQETQNVACQQPDGNWTPVAANTLRPPAAPRQPAARGASAVSSDTIFKVQQRLHDLGFYVRDNIDGEWGPNTSAAVRNFQRSKGLQASGQLNAETLKALDIR